MKKVVQMLEGTVEVDVPPLIDAQMFSEKFYCP